MCDYSLEHVRSRPAKVGEKLRTRLFKTGTGGFAALQDINTAVCVLPGTELSFATPVKCRARQLFAWKAVTMKHTTAIFRQVNKDKKYAHHDALEFPDGKMVLLTELLEGQEATVLQLPAKTITVLELKAEERIWNIG